MSLRYQIALLNVNFDNTYENAIRFNSRGEQEQYFNVDDLFISAKYVNFNIGTLLTTRIIYQDANYDLSKLMNYNYAIIKDANENATIKYYYYFINQCTFDNNKQIILDLELDVINTYYLDTEFDDCLIERAHLDRFKKVNDKAVFLLDKNSKLFEREPINQVSKRLIKRDRIKLRYDTRVPYSSTFDTFLTDKVIGWQYTFLSIKDDGYKVTDATNYKLPFSYKLAQFSAISQPFVVVATPITESFQMYVKINSKDYYINSNSLDKFLANNDGYANVVAVKFSTVAPFESIDYTGKYAIDRVGNLQLNLTGSTFSNLDIYQVSNAEADGAIMFVRYQDLTKLLVAINDINIPLEFDINEIKTTRKLEHNPKLLNADYSTLRVTNGTNYFDYDLAKINESKQVKFYTREIISPDLTKQYVAFAPNGNDNIYIFDVIKNFTGLVTTFDNSMPYSKNNLDVYLANNKNFFLQKGISIGQNVLSTLTSKSSKVEKGLNLVEIGADIVNTGLTLDNMQNARESLQNVNSNYAFNLAVTKCFIYYEIYEPIDNEKRMLDDFTHRYGFTYNRFDNIKNIDNLRVNFNYVKAQVEIIKGNISNQIKDKIRSIFDRGITMWNVTDDLFNSDVPNYERSLI